ncbi:hypothetical protein [Celeribacter naphthalenivorans]|nr:hypothetical protein [Celeribacter naphthalenivorans]
MILRWTVTVLVIASLSGCAVARVGAKATKATVKTTARVIS